METSVRRATHGGVPVLHVAGDLDLYAVSRIRGELTTALHSRAHPPLLVDLTDVQFIDSVGLGVLVGASKRLQAHGGALGLVVHHEAVLRILRISALARLFDVFGDIEGALATVRARMRPVPTLH